MIGGRETNNTDLRVLSRGQRVKVSVILWIARDAKKNIVSYY